MGHDPVGGDPVGGDPVATYFHAHARDFDSIYDSDKGRVRQLRDRLTRGTVVQRLAYVERLAAATGPARVLDVGCGAGRFALPLAARGAEVVGLDFAPDMIALAEQKAAAAGVADRCRFLVADFLTWDDPGGYDLSLAIGVVDYVADPGPLLAKLRAVTAGVVVVSFPKLWHPLVPPRIVRLRASGCPVYLYSRRKVEALASAHLPGSSIEVLGRDHMVVSRP